MSPSSSKLLWLVRENHKPTNSFKLTTKENVSRWAYQAKNLQTWMRKTRTNPLSTQSGSSTKMAPFRKVRWRKSLMFWRVFINCSKYPQRSVYATHSDVWWHDPDPRDLDPASPFELLRECSPSAHGGNPRRYWAIPGAEFSTVVVGCDRRVPGIAISAPGERI